MLLVDEYQEILQLYIIESGILESTLKSKMIGSFILIINLGELKPNVGVNADLISIITLKRDFLESLVAISVNVWLVSAYRLFLGIISIGHAFLMIIYVPFRKVQFV